MRHANNAVIMQTEQLGRIETLEEKLLALEGCNQELEHKLEEQDRVISNLMGDNLDHLQDNMHLTAHINSSSEQMVQLVLNRGSAYSPYDVNQIPLISNPMPVALLSDPKIRIPLS